MESDQVVHRLHRKHGESGSAKRQEPKETGTREDGQGHTTENHPFGTVPPAPWPPAIPLPLDSTEKACTHPQGWLRSLQTSSPGSILALQEHSRSSSSDERGGEGATPGAE